MSGGHYEFETLVDNIKYDPFGRATEWRLGNGLVVSEDHNLRYFTEEITAVDTTDTSTIMGRSYEFDDFGNVTSIDDTQDPLNSATFTYDSLYQLRESASSRYPDSIREYYYTGNGNRDTMVVNVGGSQRTVVYEYSDNKLVRIIDTGDTTFFSYDAAGNLTKRKTGSDSTTYEYNDAGQLVSVDGGTTAQYHYDGRGRRVKVFDGAAGQYVFYDQSGRIISEWRTSTNKWDRDFVYLNGRPIAKLEKHYDGMIESFGIGGIEPPPPQSLPSDIDVFYYHTDHLGTPLMMTNEYGTASWKARYHPFGELTYEWTSTTNDIRFPGQWHDRETGLHYNWHRHYNPETGRYMQPDPIGLAGGKNLYSYARNNISRYVDFSGLRVYSAEETARIIQAAKCQSTWMVLSNHTTGGIYDFGTNQPNDQFTIDGRLLSAHEFGNWLTGHVGYYKFGDFGFGAARVGGILFDLIQPVFKSIVNLDASELAEWDWDADSAWDIYSGALQAAIDRFTGRQDVCCEY